MPWGTAGEREDENEERRGERRKKATLENEEKKP